MFAFKCIYIQVYITFIINNVNKLSKFIKFLRKRINFLAHRARMLVIILSLSLISGLVARTVPICSFFLKEKTFHCAWLLIISVYIYSVPPSDHLEIDYIEPEKRGFSCIFNSKCFFSLFFLLFFFCMQIEFLREKEICRKCTLQEHRKRNWSSGRTLLSMKTLRDVGSMRSTEKSTSNSIRLCNSRLGAVIFKIRRT